MAVRVRRVLFGSFLALNILVLAACDNTPRGDDKSAAYGRARAENTLSKPTGWPTYGGQSSGTQFSAMDQINIDNVNNLGVAWTYHVGELSEGDDGRDPTLYQVTPIYANERLYLCSPFNHIIALNPATGEELWRFDPKRKLTDTFYGNNYCRGVSYWESSVAQEREQFCGKRVFEAVQDGVLVAVDADTGRLCDDFASGGRLDLNALDYHGQGQLYSTSPPAIFQNVVITGGSIYDGRYGDALDGIVRGFDVRTGKQLWHWNPIPEHLSDRVGAANAWAPLSVDQENGWVVIPTSSPSYDLLGTARKEPIPFANAVVVLDALSGKLIWSYQTVHHDLWDYDLASMPTLATVEREGKKVPAVIQATKTGFVFVLDRMTGEPLFPVDEVPVPNTNVPDEYSSPTQPVPRLPASVTSTRIMAEDAWGVAYFDKKSCEKNLASLRNEGLFTPPSTQGSVLHPSFLGGTNWGGVAYDEASGLAIINSSNLVASVKLIRREVFDEELHRPDGYSTYVMKGSPYIGVRGVLLSPLKVAGLGAPCNPPPWGLLTALDMNTGETRWQIPFGQIELFGVASSPAMWGAPNMGGPIITAGGLIFIGASPDSFLRAYNLYSGDLVWKGDIPAPAIATPMTYAHGEQAKQYVVVAAGGHEGFKTAKSDAIVAFALKK